MTLVHSDSGNLLSAVSVGTTSGGLTIYRFQHLAKTRHGLMNLATYGDRPKSCGATAPDGNARHVKTSDTTSAWLSHAPHASTSRLTTAPDTHERISRMARALDPKLAPHVIAAEVQCCKATERCEMHERSRSVTGSHRPRQGGLLADSRALDFHSTGNPSWRVKSDKRSWRWQARTRPNVPQCAPVAVDTDDSVTTSNIELQVVLSHSMMSRLPRTAISASRYSSCSSCTAAPSARQTAAWPC